MRVNTVLFIILSGLLVLSCAGGVMSDEAMKNKEPLNIEGKLAFISAKDGSLFISSADGSNLRETKFSSFSNTLSWFPDGERLLLDYWENDRTVLAEVDLEGNVLSRFELDVYRADLHQNSKQIAYFKWIENRRKPDKLSIYNIQKEETENLLDVNSENLIKWAPDGMLIAFTQNVQINEGGPILPLTQVLDLCNSEASPLVKRKKYSASPIWAPSSDKIACITECEKACITIYDLKGKPVKQISLDDPVRSLVGWSDKNERIMFIANIHKSLGRYKRKETICIINTDGTDRRIIEFEPEAYKKYGKKLNQFYNVAWWQPPVEE